MQKSDTFTLLSNPSHYVPRLIADGVAYTDLQNIWNDQEITSMEIWCEKWMNLALEYQSYGEEDLNDGFEIAAGENFWRSSLYNHYGQFLLWHNQMLKGEAMNRKVANYKKAAKLFTPPAERIEVSYESTFLPGYLRIPIRSKRPPCVLLLGGLESTKEESYLFENLCLARGLATFTFDGPGQGEVCKDIRARPDFEKAASAILDVLENRSDIDKTRFGIIGRSLGGYYAARSAAHDGRIRACVAWSVFFKFDFWDRMPRGLKDGFLYVSGKNDEDEAKVYYKSFTLEEAAPKIRCPLYILQGRLDVIFPPEHAELLAREVRGETTLDIEERGTHAAQNLAHVVRPRMADWMARKLA
jgi:2,6-dihydroxypseudooxynicotine hydrolase